MLRNFRQVFKGNQMPMTVVMVVVLLGLVAYLAPSGGDPMARDFVMARVYGREVYKQDVDRVLGEMLQRMGRQQNTEAMMPFLASRALDQMIGEKLREELAERHHVVVTDAEVKAGLEARLRQYPVFQTPEGHLRPLDEIRDILHQSGITLPMWEKEVRAQLSIRKLVEAEAAKVPVDGAWLEREHRVREEKVAFEAVAFAPTPDAVADPGDGPLSAFLLAGGARFQQPPRRVLQVALVRREDFGDSLAVDEAALRAAYESKKAAYTELRASHILFKAETEEQFKAAQAKAEALRPKLLAGLDFGKTAEAQSEDPTAKGNQGDLNWFKSGAMVKPFEDAARALKEGEISQPVRTNFGIHLIKLTGRRTKSFEEAQPELKAQLTEERFASRAKDKLEQLRKRAGERGDLAAAARPLGLKIVTSAPILDEPGTLVAGLPGTDTLVGEAFRMKVGQVSRIQKAGEAFAVLRVAEEKPTAIPPLVEIRAKVLAAWRLEEARKAALEKGQKAVAAGDLAQLGTVKPQEGTLQSLGELAQQPAIRRALLDTPVGSLTPLLWTPDGQLWVARVTARTAPAPLTFEKRQSLLKEIQEGIAQKTLGTEIAALDAQGRLHPGLSSLWGRLNGIYINPAGRAGREALPDLGDQE